MGSAAVAAWVAQVVFAALVLLGVLFGDLGVKRALVFVALWLVGYFALPALPFAGVKGLAAALFSPYVAVLDIVLAFLVLKGDVRLS